MGQILVRNLDDQVIEVLRNRARRENVSLEQSIRTIITEAAKPSRLEITKEAERIRAMTPPSAIDSTKLIREDRDNDEPYR
jgi:antitoxin FitA